MLEPDAMGRLPFTGTAYSYLTPALPTSDYGLHGFAHDAHAANCELCHEQQAKLARLKAKNKKLRKALRAVERG
jgi:hypothetical protein